MSSPAVPVPRKGQGDVSLSREEFDAAIRRRFYDPLFDAAQPELQRVLEVAWQSYRDSHKSPRTRKAGAEFHDPDYDLSIEWYETRARIREAEIRRRDPSGRTRVLLVSASPRHDQTCPGEMSKSARLANVAHDELIDNGCDVDLLDLGLITAQYGKQIWPCKGCVSTAMPLCHWPCSCYPNHGLGQTNDWMSELYPRWVAAHGVLIITPVHWYQAPSVLKLMIDRLVCADGGNPDPTTTHGKKAMEAKSLELQGWPYPKHLAGRAFGVMVHGDADGAGSVRNALTNWLTDLGLTESIGIERYIGYYEPYATSHVALDHDHKVQVELRRTAQALAKSVELMRAGRLLTGEPTLPDPRPK